MWKVSRGTCRWRSSPRELKNIDTYETKWNKCNMIICKIGKTLGKDFDVALFFIFWDEIQMN